MYVINEKTCIDSVWLKVRYVNIGQVTPAERTPDIYYLVSKDEKPYLVVRTYHEYITPFLSFILWGNYILIGMPDYVCYIDLNNFEIKNILFDKEDLYFGYFYIYTDFLLVASSNKLYCFDYACTLLWKSDELGIDGVLIHDFVDDCLMVSGEMDLPNGWIDYQIDIFTGKQVK